MFDGKSPICKPCMWNMVNYDDIETVYRALKLLDIPFIHEYWQSAIETGANILGAYIRMANTLHQFRGMTWKDSVFSEESKKDKVNIEENSEIKFNVTSEMLIRWGSNYENLEDYLRLEDFYHKMKDTNRIETPQEEEYLKKLAVISLKMDKELKADRYNQAKQLGDLFSKYMADAKFRAMDRSEADKTGGIRTFAAIFSEVEKDGHIPPWEEYRKLKGLTQDIVDKTIMHIENFTLRLNKIERMVEPPADTPKLEEDDNANVN